MRIAVDKYATDCWKWSDSLTIFVRPCELEFGEGYIWRYFLHEVIEANVARAICGGRCGRLCEKLLDQKWALKPNPFKVKTRGRAGICHVLTWLIGRW